MVFPLGSKIITVPRRLFTSRGTISRRSAAASPARTAWSIPSVLAIKRIAATWRPWSLTAASSAASWEWTSWSAMRFSSDVATRLVVRKVPITPRISIRSRNGRMIWGRILRVGSVRGRRKRGLANTVPTLRRDRVGGAEEDELVGATVRRRERVRGDGMRAPIAGRDLDRLLGERGPVALVVNAYPDVEDPAAVPHGG